MILPNSARSAGSDRTILPAGYALDEATPPVADYLRLRRISGLAPRSVEATEAGLPNSLYAAHVRQGAAVVGMGRVIGDGALFLHIVDVAIDPAHQGKGLGTTIMAALLAWIERSIPAEAYVSLMANGEAHRLYERLGFSSVLPEARGMALWMRRTT